MDACYSSLNAFVGHNCIEASGSSLSSGLVSISLKQHRSRWRISSSASQTFTLRTSCLSRRGVMLWSARSISERVLCWARGHMPSLVWFRSSVSYGVLHVRTYLYLVITIIWSNLHKFVRITCISIRLG